MSELLIESSQSTPEESKLIAIKGVLSGLLTSAEGFSGVQIGRDREHLIAQLASQIAAKDDMEIPFLELNTVQQAKILKGVLESPAANDDVESQDQQMIKNIFLEIRSLLEKLLASYVTDSNLKITKSANFEYAVRGQIATIIEAKQAAWEESLISKLSGGKDTKEVMKIMEEFYRLKTSGIDAQQAFLKKHLGRVISENVISDMPIFAHIGNSSPFTAPPQAVVEDLEKSLIKQSLRLERLMSALRSASQTIGVSKSIAELIGQNLHQIAELLGGYSKAHLNLDELLPYSSSRGIKELPNKILELMKSYGLNYDESDEQAKRRIILGNGSSGILENIFSTLVSNGDEVCMAENEVYSIYPALTARREASMRLMSEEGALNSRTRLLIATSPSNPTGACHASRKVDEMIVQIEASGNKQILIVFDEAYRSIKYNGEKVDIVKYMKDNYPQQAFVTCRSISKEQGFLGVRGGYAYVGGENFKNLEDFLDATYRTTSMGLCTNVIGQMAIRSTLTIALERGWKEATIDIGGLNTRKDVLAEMIETQVPNIGEVKAPDGGLYLWLPVGRLMQQMGVDDIKQFCREMAEEISVSATPGDGFGEHLDNKQYARLVVFLPPSTNQEIARRMAAWVNKRMKERV